MQGVKGLSCCCSRIVPNYNVEISRQLRLVSSFSVSRYFIRLIGHDSFQIFCYIVYLKRLCSITRGILWLFSSYITIIASYNCISYYYLVINFPLNILHADSLSFESKSLLAGALLPGCSNVGGTLLKSNANLSEAG